ncbi:hypothetical protein PIB30_065717, partial [Stylosanthes scabra]|nr:hypothetical protein [Stylosanthes scabra]
MAVPYRTWSATVTTGTSAWGPGDNRIVPVTAGTLGSRGLNHELQATQLVSQGCAEPVRGAVLSSTTTKASPPERACQVASKTLSMPKSWELISPSEGWMCEGDEVEKEIRGMEPSVEKEKVSKEDEEEEEDPKEEDPGEEIEELERRPEYSPIHSGHASVPDSPEVPSDRQSDSYNTSSYDLYEVWQPPSS